MTYQPPFEITSKIINLVSAVSEQVGRLDAQALQNSPQLRKQNRIHTIQSTLAIEGNTLSVEQVTAIIEGKRVLGPPKEIQEVQGAIQAYELLPELDPKSERDLLRAHKQLMTGVLTDAGKFRRGGVGIQKGDRVVHVAPPAKRVPLLMSELLDWVGKAEEHALIKSCVFHYELEFIHPSQALLANRLIEVLTEWQHLFVNRHDFIDEVVCHDLFLSNGMHNCVALESQQINMLMVFVVAFRRGFELVFVV